MARSFSKKGLNPTVFKLGLVSLFADISSEMLYPITPLFLTSVLGASMASVGFIEGLAEALASVLKAVAGRCSDRLGKRKIFIWGGYLLAAIAKPLTGMASTWNLVLLSRSLDRTGKGLRTAPRDALLAESVNAMDRGAAFGWHRLMDTLGAVIGPLLAIGYLTLHPTDLRQVFYWAFLPGLLAVVLALTVREVAHKKPIEKMSAFHWRSMPAPFAVYLGGWILFSLVNSSDVFLLMRARQSGASEVTVILLYCLYNLTYAFLSPYLGALSDTIGRKKCLVGGLLIFGIVYLGFSFATQLSHFVLLFGIYGIYMAATDGVGKAFAIDLLPESQKATAVGILGTVTGVSTVFASTLAGYVWDHISVQAPFLLGALGSVMAAAVFLFLPKKT